MNKNYPMKRTFAAVILSSTCLSFSSLPLKAKTDEENRQCIDQSCQMLAVHGLEGLSALRSNTDNSGNSALAPNIGTWGFDLAGMDKSVAPGKDFFLHTSGTYVASLEIPADRTRYGAFNYLDDETQKKLKTIITDISEKKNLTPDEQKIKSIYAGMMDEEKRDKLGIAPIKKNLEAISKLKTKSDMAFFMGKAKSDFGHSFFSIWIGADAKNPDWTALSMYQSGLSLPDRDYYFDARFKDKLDKYKAHLVAMLTHAGYKNPSDGAARIIDFETKIAKIHWTRIESRNRDKTYNPVSFVELKAYAPGFDWDRFAKGAKITTAEKIILGQNTAIKAQAKIFDETDLETLKAWQTYKTINGAAPYLSRVIYDTRFAFYNKELSGQEKQSPLWERAVDTTESSMGEVLGKVYVTKHFPQSSKDTMVGLVENLRIALKARINALSWMGPETKQKALLKLAAIKVKIGYPDKWRDYAKLKIIDGDIVGNIQRSQAFEWDFSLSKLNKKVDKAEWGMTPQTVNAYYSPVNNEIVFPAAILQAPFFDPKADMAVNYGGIGGVIGHEFTHGFDDQGSKYAHDGSLTNWWSAEDKQKFELEADKLGKQYDTFEPLPGHFIQGKLSMGENIADLGGLLITMDAYKLSLDGKEAPLLDGYNGMQRVYLGWSQVWRGKYREEAMKQQLITGPHSPGHYRVVGPLRNIDEWYKQFDIKPTDETYIAPENRVKIW